MVKWAQRSTMYALMPPSLIGTAILFVLGFVGSHMTAEHLVDREYLSAAVTTSWDVRPRSSSKLQERLAQDETQPAAPIIAEVKDTTRITTASPPQPAGEAASPAAPQIAAVRTSPAPEADVKTVETKPVVRTIVESVFGLGDTAKPEEAPAKPAEIAAQNETQQAAQTIIQTSNDQPTRATTEKSEIGSAEAVRMFGEGQRLMAAGDIRQARGLFAMSLAYGMPEAALALGRSYDLKYLARIKNANAVPDAESARNWYAEWHRQSVGQGSISSDARLDRLLQTTNAN